MLFNEFLVIIVNKDESKYRILEGYVMAHFSDEFTGIYSLSKTLKFELSDRERGFVQGKNDRQGI